MADYPAKSSPELDYLRSTFEHRATWLYFLVKSAMDNGESLDFAHKAIFNCGCFHGLNKYPKTDDLKEFTKTFTDPHVVDAFEMEAKENTDKRMYIEFHYCPLVEAWKKLTDDKELIAQLCDIAMDGDRGIVSQYANFDFELGRTIAKGDPVCEVCVRRRQAEEQGK